MQLSTAPQRLSEVMWGIKGENLSLKLALNDIIRKIYLISIKNKDRIHKTIAKKNLISHQGPLGAPTRRTLMNKQSSRIIFISMLKTAINNNYVYFIIN